MSDEELVDAARCLGRPRPPDRPRRAGRRGLHGHLRPPELEICPWALREGVILERFDHLGFLGD